MRNLLIIGCQCLLLWGADSPLSLAQDPGRAPAPAAPAQASASGLNPEPIQIEVMGLTMHIPAGGMVFREDVGGGTALLLADAAETPSWRMRVQELLPNDAATVSSIAQQHLNQLTTAAPNLRALENASTRVHDADGWLIVVEQPGTTPAEGAIVNTWLILPNGTNRFMIFALVYAASDHARLKPLFDASFGTVRLESRDTVVGQRESRLDSGREVLKLITPERLHALLGRSQWYRLYQPSGADDVEVGYSLLEIREGKRGELNPGREPRNYADVEQQTGLLVSVQARLVQNPELGSYLDSEQLYWMSWDRAEEAWSVRATIRQGDMEMSEAETGVRTAPLSPANPGVITVIRSDSQMRARNPFEWRVPEVYLSQPEHWLLGALLPRDIDQPREFSFYFFQSSRIEIAQRVDRWERASQSPAEWKLTTRSRPDEEPTISLFDDAGTMLRQTRPDGSVTVASTPEEIRRLWNLRGLRWGN